MQQILQFENSTHKKWLLTCKRIKASSWLVLDKTLSFTLIIASPIYISLKQFHNPYIKVTGCLSVLSFLARDLTNRYGFPLQCWFSTVLGRFKIIYVAGVTTFPRKMTPCLPKKYFFVLVNKSKYGVLKNIKRILNKKLVFCFQNNNS